MDKKQRFSIRKIGAVVGSVLLATLVSPTVVEGESVQYHYADYTELTEQEKNSIQKDNPLVQSDTYYLIYERQENRLPHTGDKIFEFPYLSIGLLGMLSAGSLIVVLSKKRKRVLFVLLATTTGLVTLSYAQALELGVFAAYSRVLDVERVEDGVMKIEGYRYVGYINRGQALPIQQNPATFGRERVSIENQGTNNTVSPQEQKIPQTVSPSDVFPVTEKGESVIQESLPEFAGEIPGGLDDWKAAVQENLPAYLDEVPTVTETGDSTSQEPLPEYTSDVPTVSETTEPATQEVLPEYTSEVPVVTETGDSTIQESLPEYTSEVPVVTETGDSTSQEPLPEYTSDVPTVSETTEPATQEVLPEYTSEVPVVTETGDSTIQESLPEYTSEVPTVTETGSSTSQESLPEYTSEVPTVTETGSSTSQETLPEYTSEVPTVTETGGSTSQEFLPEYTSEVPTVSETTEAATQEITEARVVLGAEQIEEIPFSTETRETDTLYVGESQLESEGVNGRRVTRQRQFISASDATVLYSEEVLVSETQPQPRVELVGTKPIEGTEVESEQVEIPFTSRQEDDDTLAQGVTQISQAGVPGEKTVTRIYRTVNGQRVGEPTITEIITREPVEEIVKVGTKTLNRDNLNAAIAQALVAAEINYVDSTYATMSAALLQAQAEIAKQDQDTTQEAIDQATKILAEAIRLLELKAPVYTAVRLEKDDLKKTVRVEYDLSNPQNNYRSGKVNVYLGDQLVTSQELVDNRATIENLDYDVEYTLKPEITYNNNLTTVTKDNDVAKAITTAELTLKKIEFKEITDVELYRKENGKYERVLELEDIPASLEDYYAIIKSDVLKDTILPIGLVEEVNNGDSVSYKIKINQPEIVQGENASEYNNGYEFLIDKYIPSSDNVYYSFKDLAIAMNNDKSGTFIIGKNLTATPLQSGTSYISDAFTGKLIGKNNDSQFGIYGLTAPLFGTIQGATVENLVLKDVKINNASRENVGALAVVADNSTITNVSVSGTINARRNVGGVVYNARNNTTLENIEFIGSINAPANAGGESRIGGLVGTLDSSLLNKGHADVDITVNHPNVARYMTGSLVGTIEKDASRVSNSYGEGKITNTGQGGTVGGLFGSNFGMGRINNVLSNVEVENGYRLYGDQGGLARRLRNMTNFHIGEKSSGNSDNAGLRFTTLGENEVSAKISDFGIEKIGGNLIEKLENRNSYKVDYTLVNGYTADKDLAYKNIEKLIPYYNKELVIKYGNKVSASSKLNTTEVLSVTPMTNGNFTPSGENIDKLFIHYKDGTKEVFDVSNKNVFAGNIDEYEISDLGIIYTSRMKVEDKYIQESKSALNSVELYSQGVYDATNRTEENKEEVIKELYFDEGILKVKSELDTLIPILLEQGVGLDKIIENKEKILLGLIYLNNYYDFKFGEYNTKDLFLTDFYNKKQDIADMLISLGSSYPNLRGRNSSATFNTVISKNTVANTLPELFTYNRILFTDFESDDEWFKDATKDHVYMAERTSNEPELASAEYKVYDKMQKAEFINYLLPMLNIKRSNIYVISNYSTFVFGSKNRKPNITMEQWKKDIDKTADNIRNLFDVWYRISEPHVKNRLIRERNTPIWDGYNANGWPDRFGRMGEANEFTSIREFFGPIGKYFRSNGLGAYANMGGANQISVHYIVDDVLSDYGNSVFSHEMVHVYDNLIYLGGYGRRDGMGAEAFARGLMENPQNGGELGVNLMFTNQNDGERWYNPSPAQFTSQEDIDLYMKRYIDTLMTIGHAETDAILKHKDNTTLMTTWFKKMDKELKANGRDQFDVVRNLNDDEKNEIGNINTIDDLIDRNYMTSRSIGNGKYDGNGIQIDAYVRPHMLSIFYGGNSSDGAAGAASFKYNAFHMWAYYGYSNGFVGYTSSKYRDEARRDGVALSDKYIINKVSNGKFNTLEEWKKVYYAETKEKAKSYLRPVTVDGKTISSYDDLVEAIDEILSRSNLSNPRGITAAQNAVHNFKQKVYKKWLQDTESFTSPTIGIDGSV